MIKYFHLFFVTLSATLFFLRGVWHLNASVMLQRRWVKRLPHVNDTLLLLTGVALVMTSEVFSFSDSWLQVKLACLLLYIVLGMLAFKWAKEDKTRLLLWLSALGVFVMMITIALSKQPLGLFAG
jgi:uncharacterized membrane protein SirB2